MSNLIWVCLGGAAGSGARYLISEAALKYFGRFLYGTFTVNLLGSFFIALIMQLSLQRTWPSPGLRIALTAGFLGGFTTYSAFNYESLRLFQEGMGVWGVLYILVTVLSCIMAGILGLACARWLA